MIPPETHVEIRRYFYAEHWKIGTIARELGIHPDAVRKAIESDRFHRGQQLRPSKILALQPLRIRRHSNFPLPC